MTTKQKVIVIIAVAMFSMVMVVVAGEIRRGFKRINDGNSAINSQHRQEVDSFNNTPEDMRQRKQEIEDSIKKSHSLPILSH